MPPTKVEPISGNGWTFTAVTAATFVTGCYYSSLAWTSPVPLQERLTVTAITVCAGLVLPFAVRHVRLARRQARRRAEVLATGLRTVATVTAVTQTRPAGDGYDPTVQITLRVMAPDGTSRSAWVRYSLPVPVIVALRPGTLLPVVLDLDDPHSAIVDWDGYRAGDELAPPEVVDLVQRGETTAAIAAYRRLTGAGLREAREAVERLARRARRPPTA